MPRPSSQRQFRAARTFTDRSDAQDVFAAARKSRPSPPEYQILVWYGVGGQGKTALGRQFVKTLAEHGQAYAKLDLGESATPIDAVLYSIRVQLAARGQITTPTFDAGFIAYQKKANPNIDIKRAFPDLAKDTSSADLIEALDDPLSLLSEVADMALPGSSLIYKWGAKLTGKLAEWWDELGRENLASIEALEADQILDQLPILLGADLHSHVLRMPSSRPVIILDTYEALWRNRPRRSPAEDGRADQWVRVLVEESPGTLYVILGRDKLYWSLTDPSWNEVVESHLLGGLSDTDADSFLIKVPIPDPNIRRAIIAGSAGLPFYLDLQVSLYEQIHSTGRTPAVQDFGTTPAVVLHRFLEHLSEAEQIGLLVSSYFHGVTAQKLEKLREKIVELGLIQDLDSILSRSSFSQAPNGDRVLHDLMREQLQEFERSTNPTRYQRIHQLLHLELEQELNEAKHWPPERVFLESFEHLRAYSGNIIDWIVRHRSTLTLSSKWAILETAYREALEGLPDNLLSAVLRNNLACCIDLQGRHAEAADALRELLVLPGAEQGQTPYLRRVRQNLAQSLIAAGDLEGASRILSASEQPQDDEEYLSVHSTLAVLASKAGDSLVAMEHWRLCMSKEMDGIVPASFVVAHYAEALLQAGQECEAEYAFRVAANAAADQFFLPVSDPQIPAQTPWPLSVMDIRSEAILPSRLLARVLFQAGPLLFRSQVKDRLSNMRDNTFRYDVDSLSGFLSDLVRERGLPSIRQHPRAAHIISALISHAADLDGESLIPKLIDFTALRLVVFVSTQFECEYVPSKHLIRICAPIDYNGGRANQVAFVLAAFRAAAFIAGFVPPPARDGLQPLAAYEHGSALDTLTRLAEGCSDPAVFNSIHDLLSQSGHEFFHGVQSGLSRENLYSIYAGMY